MYLYHLLCFEFQKGVDREMFLNWMVIDENLSWYIDQNINMFLKNPFGVDRHDRGFRRSNQIRGVLYTTMSSLIIPFNSVFCLFVVVVVVVVVFKCFLLKSPSFFSMAF